MTLVNFTVVSTNNKVVHPWKISQVGDDKVSIGDLDLIDMSIELSVAVNSFGTFMKFVIDNGIVPTRAESTADRPSAFDILMSAQQSLSLPKKSRKRK